MSCVALEQLDWLEESKQAADKTLEDLQREAFAAMVALDRARYLALAGES